jgi:cytoskeletal protein CcmA (bactofilin family)
MAEEETKPPAAEPAPADAQPTAPQDDVDALEGGSEGAQIDATTSTTSTGTDTPSAPAGGKAPKKKGKSFFAKFNVYLLLFVFILVIAGIVVITAYFQSKKATNATTLKTQDLTQATLEQLANSDATVGNSQQVLNIQSSAVFAGKVLIRDGLEVAGNLKIGGTVGLTDLTVSGTTQLGQAQINKDLSVAGNTALQGSATVAKSLQVSGSGSFSGPVSAPQITTSNLQLNGDLVLTKHIVTGGGTPGRSNGAALGSGGSSSVSGSDIAGTVTINVGSGASAGCFITVNFTHRYNSTPRVLLTPVGAAGGSIAYYTNRTSSSFSICDSTTPPVGASFAFDYFVIN